MADTIEVANCEDSGTGSLRDAVGSAVSGDTVDASALTCGTITLTSGELAVAADDLAVAGPGMGALTIDAGGASRVFKHTGAGTLSLQALTVTGGSYTNDDYARGGCIYSSADVSLLNVTVTDCHVTGTTQPAGGGIFAAGALNLYYSRLIGNTSTVSGTAPRTHGPGSPASATGGGASSYTVITSRSTISGNGAYDATGSSSMGGGLFVAGRPFIKVSTIDNNQADRGGGLALLNLQSPVVIGASTFSANSATVSGGGIYSLNGLTIHDTTIAFNSSGVSGGGIYEYGKFLFLAMDNTIVASNTAAVDDADADIGGVVGIVSPRFSLVMNTTLDLGNGDTIRDDPKLLPLADNGGLTRTHAIPSDSPAIDHGLLQNANCDQRGLGRVFGAAQDIGAYEYQGDRLLLSTFDFCRP